MKDRNVNVFETCFSETTKIKIKQHNKTRNEQRAHFCQENLMDATTRNCGSKLGEQC
jgi:hypothetical protein